MLTNETFSSVYLQTFIHFGYFAAGGLALKIVIQVLIPDMPSEYKVILKRHSNIVKKFLGTMPVQSGDEMANLGEKTTLNVKAEKRLKAASSSDGTNSGSLSS